MIGATQTVVQSPRTVAGGRQAPIVVIGGGLAGSEAAWQAARRDVPVVLYEMRPQRMTPAHRTDRLAELVCSNSLGSHLHNRALGLLKNELRRLGSLIIECADLTSLPAGDALAVDRDAFSKLVTETLQGNRNIEIRREELAHIPKEGVLVIASGPLTSSAMAEAIRDLAGRDQLYFFDAMAPIVTAESIDMDIAFRASRRRRADQTPCQMPARDPGDYINCPMSREQYYGFVDALVAAEGVALPQLDQDDRSRMYFEACLPIEVLARRDRDALAYGPMRPIGLRDPRTGRLPFAVVQLRQDDIAGTLYNLVGFQTNIRWTEQARILRLIPGLQAAEFVRFGQMHRNTFINSPVLLRPTLQWHDKDDLLFAGQLTGTEGYVGSTASGLLAGLNAARLHLGLSPVVLPRTTMMGALIHYVTHAEQKMFQPMKANFGLLPDLERQIRDKQKRHAAYAYRALDDLESWLRELRTLAA